MSSEFIFQCGRCDHAWSATTYVSCPRCNGNPDKLITDLLAKLEQTTKENDCLRAITAKIMPCHYCGVDNISKCPQGFPGCALMDDVTIAGDTIVQEYRKLKAQCEKLEALERHTELCRKALSVPENEPMLDAIEALLERVKLMQEQCRVSDEAFNFQLKRANELMEKCNGLEERVKSAREWINEQAALADKSSKEWEASGDPKNTAYRAGMWYAYNDCRNVL